MYPEELMELDPLFAAELHPTLEQLGVDLDHEFYIDQMEYEETADVVSWWAD